MSFVDTLRNLPIESLMAQSAKATVEQVRESLNRPQRSLADFATLLSPAGGQLLEELCNRSHALTQQRFGKVIRFFAPIYISNECVNNCQYCGFARRNSIVRVTLSLNDIRREASELVSQGFRSLLLVAGEHPQWVSTPFLVDCVRVAREYAPSVSLEVGPMSTEDYQSLVNAGADGLVIYQETYDREVYALMHPSGPKRNFEWRLETPERAATAGMRRIGISPLYGLADWRYEALCTAAHGLHLLKHHWKSFLTISMPRLRPSAGGFAPRHPISDRELAQMVCAFRLLFPDAGLVLSTREPARLRDGLIPLGITLISAGSHTEPGGYTGVGKEAVQQCCSSPSEATPTGQFEVADERSPQVVAEQIRRLGYDPVWKDWDTSLTA